MRRSFVIFLIVNLAIIGLLVNRVFTLITLLFEDCSEDAIRSDDIPPPNSKLIGSRPQLIPKIIHQTWKNESIPERWREPHQTCLDLHSDYEYKLWTDEKSREFISKEYPWFLETFDSYPYPIMRADSIRYFILAHYGGVYLDLDDGCNRRLDPLLSYSAWVRKTIPTGISNDAMGAVPQHPFFLRVLESLQSYNRNWRVPYITVMYSTGPLFLSVVWKEYKREVVSEAARVRVLMPEDSKGHSWSFFNTYIGSSWHREDAKAIFWMGEHWLFLTICGFAIAMCLYAITWTMVRRCRLGPSWLSFFKRNAGYKALPKRDEDISKHEV